MLYIIKRICNLVIISITFVILQKSETDRFNPSIYLWIQLILEFWWLVYLLRYPFKCLSLNRINIINQAVVIGTIIVLIYKAFSYSWDLLNILSWISLLPIGHVVVGAHVLSILILYSKNDRRRVRRFWRQKKVIKMNMDGESFDRFLFHTSIEKYGY